MGTKLENIVEVNITRDVARLALVGFGTPLLLGETYRVYDRVTTFSDPADMLDAGFAETDHLYLMAVALMSQEISPVEFKIGRKYADVNAKQKVSFSGTITGGHWHLILGEEATGEIAYNANAAAVESAIEALTAVTSVTVTGDMASGFVIEFTGVDGNKHWVTFAVDITALTGATSATVDVLQYGSAAETWTSALTACRAADDDWYCLLADTRTKADILALAAQIETANKIYVACSADSDVITSATDDVASSLKAAAYDHTALLWSSDEEHYPDAAWVGLQLPKNPGSTTWKFKTLSGITPDSLTTAQVGYLKQKNTNFYEKIAGVNIVSGEGVVASGEYIDVIHGCAWLQVRMAEKIFSRLVSAEKIPFTAQGISVIENEIRYQLSKAADNGLIVGPSVVVNTPDIASIDPQDKATRWLNGITFSATLAGAIHKVSIAGKLEV